MNKSVNNQSLEDLENQMKILEESMKSKVEEMKKDLEEKKRVISLVCGKSRPQILSKEEESELSEKFGNHGIEDRKELLVFGIVMKLIDSLGLNSKVMGEMGVRSPSSRGSGRKGQIRGSVNPEVIYLIQKLRSEKKVSKEGNESERFGRDKVGQIFNLGSQSYKIVQDLEEGVFGQVEGRFDSYPNSGNDGSSDPSEKDLERMENRYQELRSELIG